MKKREEGGNDFSVRDLLRVLFRFLAPYKGRMIIASFARLLGDIAWLYPAYSVAQLVSFFSTYEPGAPLTYVWWVLGGYGVACIFRIGGQYTSRMLGFYAAEHAALDAQLASMEHVFDLDLTWHEKENSGNKLKRIDRGSDAMIRLVRIWLGNIIEISVNLVGMMVILALGDRTIAGATLFFVGVFFVISSSLLKKASAAAREVNAKEEELSGLFFEGINNIRTVKVLNMPHALLRIMNGAAHAAFEKIRVRIFRFQSRDVILGTWTNIFRIGAFVFIALNIAQGKYDVGFLVLFLGYFGRVYESVSELSNLVQDVVTYKFAIARMAHILDAPAYRQGKDAKYPFPKEWKKIALQNVSFSYGNEDVLKDVSFDIHRGERIGIVGLSGAGKSTLFKLLLKENEAYSGDILIDDIPLRSVKKSSYYDRVTVVPQETEVFNFTLRENITIASPKEAKNEKALRRALDIAHVSSFLSRLPQGVETTIGEKGVKLSGGERQRVGIARAIFKKPDLLFFDEATSHLDVESEEKIRSSLHEFFREVTAVVIAHRLTTIREMDRILVLENGRILEEGTFDELFAKRGRFYVLWEKQKLQD